MMMATTTTTTMMKATRMMMMQLMLLLTAISLGVDCVLTLQPTLERKSVNYTVVEGRRAILPCTVHDLGTHKVVWVDQWNTVLTFNENRIIDDPRISVTRHHDEEWNLQFDKVKYGDQGVYVCQVNTTPALQQSVMLTVVVPPEITSVIPGTMVTVKEGKTATLTCNATGIPSPTVTWHRQAGYNDPLPGDTSSESCDPTSRIGQAGEVLVIHNVTRHCGGMYNCVADNGVPPEVKKTIQVKVRFVPEVRLPNKRMGQSLGRDTILDCIVAGFPQAFTLWKFKGKQLSNSGKHKIDILEHQDELDTITIHLNIKNITADDYGIYSCVSSNVEGKAREDMELYQYFEKTRAPPRTTTTSTTTTTTLSRHIIDRTFRPDPRRIHHTKKDYHQSNPPRGRLGIGNHRSNKHDRTDLIDTEYGPHTKPAEASIRAGENNCCRHEPSFILSTVVALGLMLLWRRC